MPLKAGKGKRGTNINELLHSYKETGKIGTSHPKSMKKAKAQAAAIAYSKERESK